MGDSGEKRKLVWVELKIFSDEFTGIAVRVQKSDGYHPQYSFDIGRIWDKRFVLHSRFNAPSHDEPVRPYPFNLLEPLMREAEAFVNAERASHQAEFQVRREAYEKANKGNRGGEQRHTGKTARKREKERSRANGQAAR